MGYGSRSSSSSGIVGTVITVVIVIIVVVIGGVSLSSCGYVWHDVAPNEVAIQLHKQQATSLVGPGVYTQFGFFYDIVDINAEGIPFTGEDAEVLTKDQQRIGLRVTGTVHRPGLGVGMEKYVEYWGTYQTFYENDEALSGLMHDLSQQAMKVCVGDRNFDEAAVGESRDALGACIEEELKGRAGLYGFDVRNVIVPNIIIGESVQAMLDSITQSKFETDLARQNKLKADAEADRMLAVEQGEIKVEQGIIQETRRQEAITADLERQSLEAQLVVIEAQKANELKTAQLEIEIADTEREAAKIRASIQLARETALAEMYADNPIYVNYLIQEFWAGAYKSTDKLVVPAGVDPMMVLNPDEGTTTVINAGAGTGQ